MGKRKAEDENINSGIADMLLEIAEFERNVSRNIHKYNAYRKAAATLSAHPTPITSGKEARKLDGIGEKIAKKIDEFLETGKLQKIEKIRSDDTSIATNEITRVHGIGPAKAREFIQMGIKTIQDLHDNQEKLSKAQIIGLKHVEDFELRIPREEVSLSEKYIKSKCTQLDSKYEVTVCGSYRRGKEQSGDIDALITHTDYSSQQSTAKKHHNPLLDDVIDNLTKEGFITDTLSLGDTKFMGPPYRRLDVRLLPCDQYPCAVLYFTGSDVFNKKMRTHALQQGFTLNEYTIRPMGSTGVPGEAIPVSSERDIFDIIDFPWREPHQRNA